MVLEKKGYFTYDTEDIIGKCVKCGGVVYNVPEFRGKLSLTTEQDKLFYLGVIKIGLCIDCLELDIYGDITPYITSSLEG
jgi:hypothetical protein